MITHELIERIEGEARIDFQCDRHGGVEDAIIRFEHFRGMERVLEGRDPLDALVITPRVCGICGHSHLMAAVRALESGLRNAGVCVELSSKAVALRALTLASELLQNHIKWVYLVLGYQCAKMEGKGAISPLRGLEIASKANTLSALFSGQWPHSSYALPGGVTCDPTRLEIIHAHRLLDEIERFAHTQLWNGEVEHFGCEDLSLYSGDVGTMIGVLERLELSNKGIAHGRYLVAGEDGFSASGWYEKGERRCVDSALIQEDDRHTFMRGGKTYAKNALYDGEFCETGPLARAIVSNRSGIENLIRDYGEGVLSRVGARLGEIGVLIREIRHRLDTIDLAEPSYISPQRAGSYEGIGIVEAPRGSLIHKVRVREGKIERYEIITPTQWNLGIGSAATPSVAQQAMRGSQSISHAELIFRTFDVCSVCTTH
ncbi:MAG: nickel-dependent hydrogenase large subunit [Sulfuricurvum sp.]|jgi:Ni,Fe-hydrogenase I large subunit|uniref:nickel-dependent hydrogenase large subunit n=1 Tax=Sulfuricurvum sp. TaxID=2025608 RepID=UPI0025D472DA|nr:nickel-dependent hydrogenase large subunit [Sulfuricurvum sp.]MCK9373735.1 nickel-dependent hydrogenase large subunit [Sulfuricurvum sp.]